MLALASLRLAIDRAVESAQRLVADVRAICLGLAGISSAAEGEEVVGELQHKFPAGVLITVYNDAVTALAAGTGGKLLGCSIIVGTGVSAHQVHCAASCHTCLRCHQPLHPICQAKLSSFCQSASHADRRACWQG